MDERDSNQVLVITDIEDPGQETRRERGLRDVLAGAQVNAISVPVLKKSMESFFGHLHEILGTATHRIGSFELDQVDVSAQITSEGQVCLMGTGVKIGAQGGIKFVLKRIGK